MAEFQSPGARCRYDLRSATSLALDSIFAHKLRSFLTLLGVTIGVASVILVGAAIDGVGTYARTTTEKAFGSETFILAQVLQVGQLQSREATRTTSRSFPRRPTRGSSLSANSCFNASTARLWSARRNPIRCASS